MNTRDYIGNPNVMAEQNSGGGYRPVRSPFTDEDIAKHDRGHVTLGTYVLNVDKARFMVWDVDAKEGTPIPTKEEALKVAHVIAAEAMSHAFRPGILFSGNKGYHVWVLLDEWESGAEVKRVAENIAQLSGFNGETNPKQAVAKDVGNLVKLPGGVHRVTGQRSRWLGNEPVPVPHEVFEAAVATLPPPPAPYSGSYGGHGRYPCIDSIIENPPVEGERNDMAYHFAAHMKRAGLWGEPLVAALEAAVDCSEFDPEDLCERVAGPKCDSLPASRHCPPGLCAKDKGRPSPAQLRHAQAGEVIRVEVTDNDGIAVNIAHPDGVGKLALNTKEGSDGN